MRVRNNQNINHRVLDTLGFISGTATTNEPLFNVPFEHCQSARAGFSGDQWDTLKSYTTVVADQLNKDFATYCQMAHILETGKPFIQVQLSSASDSSTNFTLSITGECWNGVSSFVERIVGSLPYETVPYNIPTWWIAAKSSGELGSKPSTPGVGMGFNALGGVTRLMGSGTPMERAMAQSSGVADHVQTLKALAHTVASNPANHDLVGEVLQGVGGVTVAKNLPKFARNVRNLPSMIRRIPSSAKAISKPGFWNTLKSVGRGVVNEAKVLGRGAYGDLEALAPEVLEVGELAAAAA
jgi:hypothetical protein